MRRKNIFTGDDASVGAAWKLALKQKRPFEAVTTAAFTRSGLCITDSDLVAPPQDAFTPEAFHGEPVQQQLHVSLTTS